MARVEPSEEVIAALEGLRRDGVPIKEACRQIKLGTETFYRWKARAEAGENGIFGEFDRRVLSYSKRGSAIQAQAASEDWRKIDYFENWGRKLVLDSGEFWIPEPWQLAPVEDALADIFQAVWLIVGEGNGKTTLTAAFVLYLLEHQITPEIPIGSATTTQAETLFRQIEGFIVRSGKLREFNIAPGMRRIDSRRTHGHTRVYPHNERSGDGVIPSGWVLDEGHLHPDLRLYRLWKGKYRKRRGIGLGISTAGEPEGEFEELRAKLMREADEITQDGPYIRAVSGSTVIHDWAVRDRKDITDFEAVARANPLELITASDLADKYDEPEMTDAHWLRRTCNIAARETGQGILPEAWDALAGILNPKDGNSRYGFLDLGWEIDNTGLGIYEWQSVERRLIIDPLALEPPVDEADIVRGILDRHERYEPIGWVYDPNAGGRQMAQQLEKGEHPQQVERGIGPIPFIEHSQDNAPMVLAASRFDEAIRKKWIVHDGNKALRKHVLSAVKKKVGPEKWRYDRPSDAQGEKRRKYPIDLLTGLLFANSVAVAEMDKPARSNVAHFL